MHLSGIAWAGGYGDPVDSLSELREVTAPSGTAMAIRGETFKALGGFTDELFMYQEDLLLGWRARLAGLRVVVDPEADVYHDYEFSRNTAKQYLLERNRLVFVLSAFSPRLLLLLSPVLISTELAMAVMAARERWLGAKMRGWAWCARNARWLLHQRRETQRLRRVSDRQLAALLSPVIAPKMIPVPGPDPGGESDCRRLLAACASRSLTLEAEANLRTELSGVAAAEARRRERLGDMNGHSERGPRRRNGEDPTSSGIKRQAARDGRPADLRHLVDADGRVARCRFGRDSERSRPCGTRVRASQRRCRRPSPHSA